MKEIEKAILVKALERYGSKDQAGQLMGEMGELAAEITRHFFQGRNVTNKIAEEIADVQIMLDQIILHLGIGDGVKAYRVDKIKRLGDRLNQ